MVLVFILLFFPWVGLYPGGVFSVSQTAWGTAFGGYTVDPDIKPEWAPKAKDKDKDKDKKDAKKEEPGASVLMIFYLLLFFPVLIVTLGSLVLTFKQFKLPPGLAVLVPWRWGIVAGLILILFLFLGLQLLLGFSLESKTKEAIKSQIDPEKVEGTKAKKLAEMARGSALEAIQRTFWLNLVVVLHILAILAAALVFWIGKRGEQRPLPKLELMW
jgi:hypothetical protein